MANIPGSYVEFLIMLSQGPRDANGEAPIRFRLQTALHNHDAAKRHRFAMRPESAQGGDADANSVTSVFISGKPVWPTREWFRHLNR